MCKTILNLTAFENVLIFVKITITYLLKRCVVALTLEISWCDIIYDQIDDHALLVHHYLLPKHLLLFDIFENINHTTLPLIREPLFRMLLYLSSEKTSKRIV